MYDICIKVNMKSLADKKLPSAQPENNTFDLKKGLCFQLVNNHIEREINET